MCLSKAEQKVIAGMKPGWSYTSHPMEDRPLDVLICLEKKGLVKRFSDDTGAPSVSSRWFLPSA